jgi:hypothetical protein
MFVKTLIVSDINVYDVNDKFLESGIYYFIIKDFVRGKNIIGDLIYKNNKIQYEFRYFSFMMMLIKGQSYLARRINIELLPTELMITNSMPDNPSPKKSIERKKPKSTFKCMICLNENYNDSIVKKLGCNHRFHYDCINKWLVTNKSCPICRKKIITNLIV